MIGSTAIEDRLQDGVPDCIYNLGRAGIKIWYDDLPTVIDLVKRAGKYNSIYCL